MRRWWRNARRVKREREEGTAQWRRALAHKWLRNGTISPAGYRRLMRLAATGWAP